MVFFAVLVCGIPFCLLFPFLIPLFIVLGAALQLVDWLNRYQE